MRCQPFTNTFSWQRHENNELEGCTVLNEHNTVFGDSPRSGPLYDTHISLGLPESSAQTTTRSLQPILQGSLGDRPTVHGTRSVTIGEGHSGEAKFCYCPWLQQVFIAADDSNTPCLPFLHKHSPDGAPLTEVGDIQWQTTTHLSTRSGKG